MDYTTFNVILLFQVSLTSALVVAGYDPLTFKLAVNNYV
jgi:hypothetical protein